MLTSPSSFRDLPPLHPCQGNGNWSFLELDEQLHHCLHCASYDQGDWLGNVFVLRCLAFHWRFLRLVFAPQRLGCELWSGTHWVLWVPGPTGG